MDKTQPGFPRPSYTGNARTEWLVGEAQRICQSVTFSEGHTALVFATTRPVSMTHASPSPQAAGFQQPIPPGSPAPSTAQPSVAPGQDMGSDFRKLSFGPEFSAASLSLPYIQPGFSGAQYPQQAGTPGIHQPQQYPTYPMQAQTIHEVNEFGTYNAGNQFPARPSSVGPGGPSYQGGMGGPQGPRFATVGSRPVYPGLLPEMGDRPPSLDIAQSQDSFSSSVAQALAQDLKAGPSSPTHTARSGSISITYSKSKEAESEKKQSESPPPSVYTLLNDERTDNDAGDAVGNGQYLTAVGEEAPQLAYMSSEPQGTSSTFSSPYEARRVQFGGDQESETLRGHSPTGSYQNTQLPTGCESTHEIDVLAIYTEVMLFSEWFSCCYVSVSAPSRAAGRVFKKPCIHAPSNLDTSAK